jgi:hypothetical protein
MTDTHNIPGTKGRDVEHEEFISGWRAKRVEVDVDRSKALEIANAKTILPARSQREYLWWTTAWLLTLPVALIAGIVIKWWAGLLIVLFVTPALFRQTNKRAKKFVIDYALENGVFYSYAIDHDVIRVRQKP